MYSEIVLQGLISFVLALIIVELALPYFNQFIGKEISILHLKSLVILFISAVINIIFCWKYSCIIFIKF